MADVWYRSIQLSPFFHFFPDVDDFSRLVLRLSLVDLEQVKGTYEIEEFFKPIIPRVKFRALLLDILSDQPEFGPALFIR